MEENKEAYINKKSIGKIVNIILNILVGFLVIILLITFYNLFQTKVLGDKYSNFFGHSIFEVVTNSMHGEINAGDWVIVKITKDIELKDVITFEYKGKFLTHRVVGIHGGTYITKGDANSGKDDPVDESQIVGKVTKVLKNFGIWRKTLFNPGVLITLIITIFLFNRVFDKKDIFDKEMFNNLKIWKSWKNILKKKNVLVEIENRKIEQQEIKEETPPEVKIELYENLNDSDITTEPKEEKVDAESELEKTMFFRLVTVNEDEENQSDSEEESVINSSNYHSEASNIITVDKEELEHQLVEEEDINEEIYEKSVEVTKQEQTSSEDPELKELEESLTKFELKLLRSHQKKNKNVIDAIINIKKEEIEKFVFIINKGNNIGTNEVSIRNKFIETYINARYYDIYNENNIAKELKLNYQGNDKQYDEKVDIYVNIFALLVKIDKAKDNMTTAREKRTYYKEQIMKYFKDWSVSKTEIVIEKLLNMQKEFSNIIKYLLKMLDTKIFDLNLKKLSSKRNMFIVKLEHNIAFNKAYSDYIINKTYTEGIVAEDKISVLLTLLQKQIVSDMIYSTFNKQYIMYVPDSLYDKEKKLIGLLKMIDDEYAKSHILLLISLEGLIENSDYVKELKKLGYRFALNINDDIDMTQDDKSKICLVDYIFIDKDIDNKKMLSYIPEDLQDMIFYESMTNKIEVGGEEV